MCSERNGDLGRPTADGDSGPYGSWLEIRRHAETSEPIPCPSLRAKRSNPGAAVRPPGLLAPRMLWECCGPWIASSQGLLAMTDGSPFRLHHRWAAVARRPIHDACARLAGH